MILETTQNSRCQAVERHGRHSLWERGCVLLFWASASFLLSYRVLARCPLPGCFTLPKALLSGSTGCMTGRHYQSFHAWTPTPMSGSYVLGHCSKQSGALQSTQCHHTHGHLQPQLSCTRGFVPCFSTTISPVVLKVDCGKDRALGMGYGEF